MAGVLVARTGSAVGHRDRVRHAVFVAVRAVILGREVLAVLGQHAPAGVEPARVEDELGGIAGVTDVHDLHLWTLTSGMNVATAHLVAASAADTDGVLAAARDVLRERFGVEHATLPVETDPPRATRCPGDPPGHPSRSCRRSAVGSTGSAGGYGEPRRRLGSRPRGR